ncbi:MAG TPA: hypothetical protein VM073_09450 [Usitatibacter sp.]|nr:hypothetical protein [Usitatibacter sp.]
MVLVGVPAVAAYVVSIAALLLGLMGAHSDGIWIVGGVAGIALALPAALYGMGAWGRWRYLWAFVALPLAFAAVFIPILLIAQPQGEKAFKTAALIAFAAASLATYVAMRLVRASYARAR